MPKLINFSCVKNVYYMFNIISINSDYISTLIKLINQKYINCSQKLFNKQILKSFTYTISTYNLSVFNLLNKSFTHYPHSLLLRLKNEI